jgi:predicted nucleic acid-binding protein
MRIVRIDPIIALKSSELIEKYANSPLHKSDSLIAATAWAKKLILVTRNRKHFEFINEIQLLIPKGETEDT